MPAQHRDHGTPGRLERACRWLLRVFPKRFQERHGPDLMAACRDADLRGRARPLEWSLVVLDLLWSGIAVRLEHRRERRRHGGGRRGEVFMSNVATDVRQAARGLLKSPGFTAVALLTVALGIGANAAIFAVVNAVVLRPLPYERPEELVAVRSRFLPESGFDFPTFSLDPVEYEDYRDSNRSFAEFAAWATGGRTLIRDGVAAERIQVVVSTWNLLPLLEVRPTLGRLFVEEDDEPGAPPRLVLSQAFWRSLGADPTIVGSSLILSGRSAEVIGVLPEGFHYPGPTVDVYTTLNLEPNSTGRQSHYLQGLARLAPGVTFERAQADMDRIMARWAVDYPDIHTGHFFIMDPLKDARVGNARRALWLLMGAVGFVLLVVCANLANLLLVRGQTREREGAIRRALGAGRWRILQGALAQSGLLALGGAALGLLLAVFGVDALLGLVGSTLPRSEEVAVDGTVVAFAGGLALAIALVFAAVPTLQTRRRDDLGALAEGGRASTARRSTLRTRNGLVAAEVALSIVLVIGAGLMTRSFVRLVADDTGFDPDHTLVASLSLPSAEYETLADATAFYGQLLERVRGLPGVDGATGSSNLPILSGTSMADFVLAELPEPGDGEPAWNAAVALVRPEYFETLRIPIVRGRGIERRDTEGSEPVVVVSESLVRQFVPADMDPLGMRMRFPGSPDEAPWWRIVGVTGDVKLTGLGQATTPAYYLAHAQAPTALGSGAWGRFMTLALKTSGEPETIIPALRSAVRDLDPSLPLISPQPYGEAVSESVAQPRMVTTLMGFFASVALLLGAIGIYGVTAFAVTQRRHEIGIRMALGARADEVVALVVKTGMWPVLAGVAVGVLGALAGTRLLESLLFEVSRTDLPTYLSVIGMLTAVGLAACWLPARRAMRVDPMTTLKAE